MMGIANLFLIPLAIAVGRRPVVLGCGVLALAGAGWAGASQSLNSHIAARCFQALGAGTVECLIPFIIQDVVHFHQRNTAVSAVFAMQGTIIIGIGVAAPYCIIHLSWRWVYFITAIASSAFLIGVFFFMPETRWQRSKEELCGMPKPDDRTEYTPRTRKDNLAIFSGTTEWRQGINALLDSLRTFFYPHIFFVTMLNSAMIAATFAASYTVSPALLTAPWSWPFLHLGFSLFPVVISAIFVVLVTGKLADKVANTFAKKRGRRLPENQLINLALPSVAAIVGSIMFGVTGAHPDQYHWALFLLGLALMAFGFLGANTVGAVYVLECYPQLAGYVLLLAPKRF
jgi:MFS family permease